MLDKKESVEDYLEHILMLKERQEIVRAIDVARLMNFSKASVSIALKKMKTDGLVIVEANGNLLLTCGSIGFLIVFILVIDFFFDIGLSFFSSCSSTSTSS